MGALFGGGGQEAQAAALKAATDAYGNYRPEAMQARLNLLSNASTAYQGMNNALQTMYGGRQQNSPYAQFRPQHQQSQSPFLPKEPVTQQQPQSAAIYPDGSYVSSEPSNMTGSERMLKSVFDPAGIFL